MKKYDQLETSGEMKYDVFICYVRADNEIAIEIRQSLSSKGIKCFMAEMDISIETWEDKILAVLKEVKIGVVLLTPQSVNSRWVMCEAGALWALGKLIVPAVMYVRINEMPGPINRYQAIGIEAIKGRRQLVDEIGRLLDSLRANT